MATQQPIALFYCISRIDQHSHQQYPKTEAISWFRFIFKGFLRSRSTHPNSDYPRPLTTIKPLPLTQLPQYIGCKRFFREGPDFLRTNLSNQYLSRGDLDLLIEEAMCEVQQLFDAHPSSSHSQHAFGNSYVLPLCLVIFIDALQVDNDPIEQVMEESMQQQVRMIPASKEAIGSLKKFKPTKQCGLCSICMEDFDLDNGVEEVLAMSCDHLFHQQCIVSWLEISHTCPLCRYPMPTAPPPTMTL